MGQTERVFAGAMSGTSADGVDIAVVGISGGGVELSVRILRHHHMPYGSELRRRIFALRQSGVSTLEDLAMIGREISLAYAHGLLEAFTAAQVHRSQVTAIGAHGQTLLHAPPNTLQWLDPALIAAETGVPVVSDFRRADCAAGGQGAPLVPYADYALFRHPLSLRALVNLGGIANVTVLRPACALGDVVAFDTGPGNCISDFLCRKHDPNGIGFDRNGQMATVGLPDLPTAQRMLAEPFFAAPPPKSTDVPQMIAAWEKAYTLTDPRPLPDLLATACYITASAILDALYRLLGRLPDELIVSGGGCRNQSILGFLRATPGMVVRSSDEYGLPAEAKEAVAFAILAAAHVDGIPANIPSVTGARRSVVLGSLTPRPSPA
ncbi:MAG: anhydro-N-acetylmuramic acid kinase [Phycisphaerae bacterium]|nr:anhydro-N-acetylmuramic acid kinase [Phycisphaerae bacterium]MDW8261277.1 anhydro-N-acetylmuramic acid kinase [Phycisphaerales bacterium]